MTRFRKEAIYDQVLVSFSGLGSVRNPVSKTSQTHIFIRGGNITDEVHSWPPTGDRSDVGGTLLHVKYTQKTGGQRVKAESPGPGVGYYYDGFIFAKRDNSNISPPASNGWTVTPPLSALVLMAKGTTAIARCAPTNPHASVSQLLGEIRRDGIPAVPLVNSFRRGARPATRFFQRSPDRGPLGNKDVGSEYLNVEFGWKPLFNDVRKLATARRDQEKILSQYVRDSGRLVHRRYEFPEEFSSTVTGTGNLSPAPPLVSYLYDGSFQAPTTKTVTVSRRIWFEGDFTYHVPRGADIVSRARRELQMANHLTGVGITPAVLWDLMPWSWAIDWVTNTGDVMQNITSLIQDGLVVVRGYIMAETVTETIWTNNGIRLKGVQDSLNLKQSFTETVKQRQRATPFGFGLNITAFSPRQLAIVAALGLSRDGRKLAL